MKTLVLIDSNAIIHRAYHAIPKSFSNRQGEQTNVTYGYTTTLIKALEDLKPDYIAATFDLAGKTFRHEEYSEYKAQRVKADQELYDQIPRVRELLEVLNIPVYELAGFEADDVIGTIVQKIQDTRNNNQTNSNVQISNRETLKVYIVTGDKDAFQLVDGNVFVYNLKGGLSQTQIVDRAKIKEDWNLDPEDFIDLKALAGDPSDNIPGVPGVGNVTATKLLQQFDTMEKMYEEIEARIKNYESNILVISTLQPCLKAEKSNKRSLGSARDDKKGKPENDSLDAFAKDLGIKPRILNLLIDNKDQAFLSQRLATIRRDVPIKFDLEKSKWGDYDRDRLAEFFKEMGFKSLLRRFGSEIEREVKTEKAKEQANKDEQLKLL